MYTKQEASQLRQQFWTAFGQYMSPVLSAEGTRVAWVNYKTGIKDLYFKMTADTQAAAIAIEIRSTDAEIQRLYFEQFQQLKTVLHNTLGEEWNWQLHTQDEYGSTISRIDKTFPGISILKKEDWPDLISFFKPRIIALDEFWSNAKYFFEAIQ